MIIDSHVDLAGFVASEPAFKRLENGTSTAKLRVAYTERRFNRDTGEWADGPTSFVTVLCWRTLADNVAISLRKGEPVMVRGRLRVREYEGKDGSRGTETEIDASSIGHDLSRGVAHFSRTRRVTSFADWLIELMLLVQVIAGIYAAIFHPWAISWYAASASPYIRSLFRFNPDITYLATIPWPVKLHIINGWLIVLLFPFTRLVHMLVAPLPYIWRKPEVVRWYGIRKLATAIERQAATARTRG